MLNNDYEVKSTKITKVEREITSPLLRLSFFSKLAVVIVFRCSSVKNLA